MEYAILIYETQADFALRGEHADPVKRAAYWAEWPIYTKALLDAGIMRGGAGLEPPGTATTLRFNGGKPVVQDGPFADTKEQLGGFYLIDVPDLDAALEWAARVPQSTGRMVEVRPKLVMPN